MSGKFCRKSRGLRVTRPWRLDAKAPINTSAMGRLGARRNAGRRCGNAMPDARFVCPLGTSHSGCQCLPDPRKRCCSSRFPSKAGASSTKVTGQIDKPSPSFCSSKVAERNPNDGSFSNTSMTTQVSTTQLIRPPAVRASNPRWNGADSRACGGHNPGLQAARRVVPHKPKHVSPDRIPAPNGVFAQGAGPWTCAGLRVPKPGRAR